MLFLNKKFFLELLISLLIVYLPNFFLMGIRPLLGFGWRGDGLFIALFGAAVAFVFLVINFFGLFSKASRLKSSGRMLISVLVIALFIPMIHIAFNFRSYAFYVTGQRAMPVVDALKEYIVEKREIPENVQQLIPAYLEKIPERIPPLKIEKNDSDGWRLFADVSIGILNWDEFMYLSENHYMKEMYGSSLEDLGNGWYYYHE